MISPALVEAAVTGPLRQAPLRHALAMLAIALGVAMGLAIHLINRSAADAISVAARSAYGLADLSIRAAEPVSGGHGRHFDEALYPVIAEMPGVEVASPIVEVQAKLAGRREALKLYGVDVFRSRLLQPAFAQIAGPREGVGRGSIDRSDTGEGGAGGIGIGRDDIEKSGDGESGPGRRNPERSDPERSGPERSDTGGVGAGGSGSGGSLWEADGIYLSAAAAQELGVPEDLGQAGSVAFQVGLQRYRVRIAGVLPPSALTESAGMMDIATVQWKFGVLGQLSRIDLRLAKDANLAQVRDALSRRLPPGLQVIAPGEAGEDALRLSRAYRSNLTALALVALFTGGFFVYSTQAMAALRRRREFAILHAIGVTRAQQLGLALSGAVIIGTCGAVLGILIGVALAQVGLHTLGADLGAGHARDVSAGVHPHVLELLGFAMLGLVVAIAGALGPALQSARVPTSSALKSGDVASVEPRSHFGLAGILAVLALMALLLPPVDGLPLPGYVSIALLLIAVVAALPGIVRAVVRLAPRVPWLSCQLALAQIGATARYASLSLAAIVVSFSLMVSMAIMVTSFRTSLDHWTQRLLPADLAVRAGYVGQSAHFEARDAQRIAQLPGVERAQFSRFSQVTLSPKRPAVTLIARTLDPPPARDVLWLVGQPPACRASADGTVGIWISEAISDLHALHPGDIIDLVLSGQRLDAQVRGIWRDYEHRSGAIVMNREDYIRFSGDHAVNTIWLWLDEDASLAALREDMRAALPAGADYDVRLPGDLRRMTLAAFDRTFAVTYLLEFVAVFIGLFGIAAGISAQTLARRGEFGALRHLGMTRGQIGAMLGLEGALLGAMGGAVGLVAGALVSLILIYVVNRQSFHWSMDLFLPLGWLAVLSGILILAAALIAVAAGRRAMSTDVLSAVREDW